MLEKEKRIDYNLLDEKFICEKIKKGMDLICEENICSMDDKDFIKACYLMFMNRIANDEEIQQKLLLLDNGLSKRGMMFLFYNAPEFNRRFELKNLELYKRDFFKYEWDVTEVLKYEEEEFIEKCYNILLNRTADENGFYFHIKALYSGMPKEAIIYLFVTSEEIKNVKTIKDVDRYRSVYENYINKDKNMSLLFRRKYSQREKEAEIKAKIAVVLRREKQIMNYFNIR